jgi:hypothetical protein
MKSGYWNVTLQTDEKEDTILHRAMSVAFIFMPFGLCNGPETLERLMNCVLRGLTFEAWLVNQDECIVVGRTL